ncbi:hypothetical protein QBC32DRAFT_341667 [Pseudoneurospora amorphoporcata]|uniref:Secreted protein n=1 Tax=Pseudoneurospora amorphoporcata TaxID=241081 RepID=A0AAN6SG06_9PEZI|nr:hypothetical protein QBC32DRAFT_341667 [Pseudoneurospora amorphoporcata]
MKSLFFSRDLSWCVQCLLAPLSVCGAVCLESRQLSGLCKMGVELRSGGDRACPGRYLGCSREFSEDFGNLQPYYKCIWYRMYVCI